MKALVISLILAIGLLSLPARSDIRSNGLVVADTIADLPTVSTSTPAVLVLTCPNSNNPCWYVYDASKGGWTRMAGRITGSTAPVAIDVSGNISVGIATSSSAGIMSAADKSKLDGLLATSGTNTGDETTSTIVSKLAGSSPSVATLTTSGFIINTPQVVSIPDNGTGSVVNYTLTPSSSNVEITCLDTSGGCNVALSESNAVRGLHLNLMNAGTISFMITDTTGVQETSANFNVGSLDVISFVYISDRYLEVSRSNN